MQILLDTHVYLWWLANSPRLGQEASEIIATADSVYISSASIWEAAIKTTTGKLEADIDELCEQIHGSGFVELPVTLRHAAASARLPLLHKDPFDRMLVAQAQTEPLHLLTADHKLAAYGSLVRLV